MPISRQKKIAYVEKTCGLLDDYSKALVVNVENFGSRQMQQIRTMLRGTGRVLMGKNSLIRRALHDSLDKNPQWECLLPHIVGNVGLLFTNGDLVETAKNVLTNKVIAPAKPGAISPVEFVIPKGNSGLEPSKTSFLQALNIPSKINKGQIEFTNDVVLLRVGTKVGTSEATLLNLLGIKPFVYTLKILKVYDNGEIYDTKVLEITDELILEKFKEGIQNIASVSLSIGYPTLAGFPHSFMNAYKNVLAVSIASDYTYKQSELVKEMINNPSAFITAAAQVVTKEAVMDAPKAEETPKKEEPADDDDDFEGGLDLFGDE